MQMNIAMQTASNTYWKLENIWI